MIVGKEVQFKVNHSTPNRQFGQLSIQTPIQDERDITRILVKSGWVKVKDIDPKRLVQDIQDLQELETTARKYKLGVWNEIDYLPVLLV
jgi:endonuclease YncB( thermonuclease family)